jgi:ferredoxin-nitrite reductase
MKFLRPYNQLNHVEQWKLERHPLDVYRAVIDSYSKQGPEAIAAVDGEQERLKWVGLYPQRQGGNAYMLRIKVPGGRLEASQARVIGEVADEFANGPTNPTFGTGFCDITTRQDIQLHWIRIEDLPEIWRRLESVGITTIQGCGDGARNVLCCPVAGLDADEAFDAYPIAREISDFFTGNREYANLPRKFKLSVTGCREDCAQAEINDVGLWPAQLTDDTLGFNVLVGGGLSDGPRMASDIDIFIEPEQAMELTRAIAQLYGELGNRENRGICRMRYLVQELGPEEFRNELVARCDLDLRPAGEALTHSYRGDHLGVHEQKDGRYYVGCNVTVGRIAGSRFADAARLAEEYGSGELRLSTDQNFIICGVSKDRVDELLGEELLEQFRPDPGPFERGAVACTGTEFCRFAVIETKARQAEWARWLDDNVPTDGLGVIRTHLSGCSASCAQPQIADIGLRGETSHKNDAIHEAVDVGLGGSLGTDAAFIDFVEGAKPTDEIPGAIANLVSRYRSERRDGELFYQWCRRLENEDLRNTLAGDSTPRRPE